MDKEKLYKLKALLDELNVDSRPTDEELDYDDDLIDLYYKLYSLKETLEYVI